MGVGFSNLGSCLKKNHNRAVDQPRDITLVDSSQLDETLGHSFCYVRSSARFPSPIHSDRFLSPTRSLRFDDDPDIRPPRYGPPEIGFKAISGASVSANTSTPRTGVYDDGIDTFGGGGSRGCITNGFESTSSFSAIPLQPFPKGCDPCGPSDRGFFMSGPLERGGNSGPLDGLSGVVGEGRIPFSAPLGGSYKKKKRKKGFAGIRRNFYRKFSEKKRHWVVPVRYFAGKKETGRSEEDVHGETEVRSEGNVQWALGKAGEDRVHVVVSEEHGWLFVGIYDGFNGPDAPDFLMSNLYSAVFQELEGLFWDSQGDDHQLNPPACVETENGVSEITGDVTEGETDLIQVPVDRFGKRVTFEQEHSERKRHLWEYLSEADPDEGIDLSGPGHFAFSVDDALSLGGGRSSSSMRWLLLSKLKQGLYKHKGIRVGKTEPWRFGVSERRIEDGNRREQSRFCCSRKRRVGPADHVLVLSALSRALNDTEIAYLDMTDKFIDTYPELALMGSCLLAVLMRDDDVYVMNLGDSRAIVAQNEQHELFNTMGIVGKEVGKNMEGTTDDCSSVGNITMDVNEMNAGFPEENLTALQLSTDHSTCIEDEVYRIKKEHPNDDHCIVNDRVKGRLKVTRAFGAGYLKNEKWNYALLEMFRNEFVGTAPYISSSPSLHHHKLCSKDQFLILSSDGLYQYLSNQEAVFLVASFMEKFPEGDPAQHLIEELLFRAAKKAGMDLHELLDIPQGDRRKYHDDVTVMVISLEGRIWKSSGKCL